MLHRHRHRHHSSASRRHLHHHRCVCLQVIFDEIHYMRDKERGVVWEESIIMLPHKVRGRLASMCRCSALRLVTQAPINTALPLHLLPHVCRCGSCSCRRRSPTRASLPSGLPRSTTRRATSSTPTTAPRRSSTSSSPLVRLPPPLPHWHAAVRAMQALLGFARHRLRQRHRAAPWHPSLRATVLLTSACC